MLITLARDPLFHLNFEYFDVISRGFIKVLNRRAIEFDTREKNWQGPEGLAPKGGLGAYSPGKF